MPAVDQDPFAEILEEIPLCSPPLDTVLCQIRYETNLRVNDETRMAEFQGAIGDRYPRLSREQGFQFVMPGGGAPPEGAGQTLWRFQSKDRDWRLTLATDFVSLETRKYLSRADFAERLTDVMTAFSAAYGEAITTRIGVRYINLLSGAALEDLESLVRPEALGPMLMGRESSGTLVHSICDSRFLVGGRTVQTKWGLLPAGAVVDPAYAKRDEAMWVLDLDVYKEGEFSPEPENVSATFCSHAALAYGVFRWAVHERYLERFGGEE